METELERLLVRIMGNSADYLTKLNECSKATTKFATAVGKKLQSVGQSFKTLGMQATRFLTLPVLGLGAAAIKVGSDFESGFAGVIKTMNATDAELIMLRQGFKDLAEEVPISVEELLHIGEIAGQLGIATDNVLDFTRVIGSLATATNMTAEQGAIEMARFANIMGLPQSQFENLASSLVSLGNNLATREDEIMSMAMRLAGAGRMVGMTSADVMALSASLSSVGIQAELGGTAFSSLFLQMTDSIGKNSKEMEAFAKASGKSIEDFKRSFRTNAVGAVEDLLRGLSKLNSEEQTAMISEMGDEGKRMARALINSSLAVDKFGAAIKLSNKAFKDNTALAREADIRFKTFGSQVILLKNQFKLLLGEVFEVMRPLLVQIVGRLKELTKWFRALSPAVKSFAVVAGLALASIGPVLIAIGVGLTLLGGAISTIVTLFGGLSATLGFIFSIPGGIALVVAGLAAAVAMVVAATVEIEGLSEGWQSAKNAMADWLGKARGFFANFRENMTILKAWLIGQWEIISNRISVTWMVIKTLIRSVVGSIKLDFGELVTTARDWAMNTLGFFANFSENAGIIFGWLGRTFKAVLVDMAELWLTFSGNMIHNATLAGTTILQVYSGLADTIAIALSRALTGDLDMEHLAGVFQRNVGDALSRARDGFKGPLEGFQSRLEKMPELNLEFGGLNLPQFVTDQVEEAGKAAEEAAGPALAPAQEALNKLDTEAVVKFNVEGIDAVEAGTAEAMARVAEFKQMRPSVSQQMQVKASMPGAELKESNKTLSTIAGTLSAILQEQQKGTGLNLALADIGGT